MGTVHGGCISTVFDACTSVALVGRYSGEKWGGGGVSRGLGVTFLKGIVVKKGKEEGEGKGKGKGEGGGEGKGEGEEEGENDVLVECEVVGGVGRRNVVLRGTMKRRNGEVLAICEHSKVNIEGVDLPVVGKGEKNEGKNEGKESKL
ncbi:hypothetical protein SBOR_4153 [Sclerotinia borealis F-4128]|uniref:Thioesterase domain-containing protein n=1 Tax=Sclerotinia borealis (strain F-4128) TaxID=1432307 RepID=W9CLG2_SCLBF|nr:hypothetical protein SBOR_4153 [Sclerotinia borealis F-4128]